MTSFHFQASQKDPNSVTGFFKKNLLEQYKQVYGMFGNIPYM